MNEEKQQSTQDVETQDVENVTTTVAESAETPKKQKKRLTKKTKIILIVVASVILVGAIVGLVLGLTLPKVERVVLNGVTVKQIENQQRIQVDWDTSGGAVGKVDIVIKKSNGLVDSSVTINNPSQLAKGYAVLDTSYGRNTVEITVSNRANSASKKTTVDVYTDEYVIAPLVATMPVTIFSLRMEEITDNYTIPTFVWLQRGAAWNYKEMPENVYLIPMSTYDIMAGYSGDNPSELYYQTSKWVGELYEMNNNSKFHFYVNDYHPFVWLECTYLNRIPQANYDVTLLTDGTASNAVFETLYTTSSALNDYNKMVEEYNDFKQDLWDDNNPDFYNNLISIPLNNLNTRNWILPMLKEEPNVKVILTRAYFANNDEVTDATIKQYVTDLTSAGKIEVVNLNTLLNALTDEGREHIKKLYKFGDNVFEKAVNENKTAMVILGTRTQNEKDFEKYVAATKAVYGNDCVYYYKGHPWTPTASDPAKAAKLEQLGLIDVDSSIAAELLFFFNPEIVATGYGSSTFGSLRDEQTGGIFGAALDVASAPNIEENKVGNGYVKFVINEVSLLDSKFNSIASAGDMVVEFKDNSKYDVAICKVTGSKTTIKYYKLQGSSYVEVK